MVKFDTYADDYNRLLNESLAASGEDAAYFADYKARFVAEHLVDGPAARILDFGCGVGNVAAALARRLPGAAIDGYDPSDECLERIAPELKARGRFTADPETLGSGYDVAVVAGVFHHVPPQHRADFLARVIDRLGAGGRLAVFEHNPANPITRRVVESCPYDADAELLPAREATALLTAAGLISVRRVYIVFFPRALRVARPLERHLGWCPLGAQYVVVGEKGP